MLKIIDGLTLNVDPLHQSYIIGELRWAVFLEVILKNRHVWSNILSQLNEFIMTVMHPMCSFLPEKVHLHTALWRLNNQAEKGTGLNCFGHCRCSFFCHSLQPVLFLFSNYLLLCLSPHLSLSPSPP